MEPRLSENAFEPLREAAISDSTLTHPALRSVEDQNAMVAATARFHRAYFASRSATGI